MFSFSLPVNDLPDDTTKQRNDDATPYAQHLLYFAHEALRRSRTSCATLEIAMHYIGAIRDLVPNILGPLAFQGTVIKSFIIVAATQIAVPHAIPHSHLCQCIACALVLTLVHDGAATP